MGKKITISDADLNVFLQRNSGLRFAEMFNLDLAGNHPPEKREALKAMYRAEILRERRKLRPRVFPIS